ncbi:MAG: hypothetical protein PHN88_10440 [Ignavibacteria bacterium]|nr:hypothetical protein [Ignavibacteria bacterium]
MNHIINYIYDRIRSISNIKSMLILLSMTLMLMFAVNILKLPVGVQKINETAQGVGILDMRIFYDSQTAYHLLDDIGYKGRHDYLNMLIFFDFIFPLIYSITLAVILNILLGKIFIGRSAIIRLSLLPFLAGLFDYLENASIITMILYYPKVVSVSFLAGYFTFGKWLFTIITILVIFSGLIKLTLNIKFNNKS